MILEMQWDSQSAHEAITNSVKTKGDNDREPVVWLHAPYVSICQTVPGQIPESQTAAEMQENSDENWKLIRTKASGVL